MKPIKGMRDKRFWANLSKAERARLMYLQMAPAYTMSGGYLPDDCSECGACGEPMVGSGHCNRCLNDYIALYDKGIGLERTR